MNRLYSYDFSGDGTSTYTRSQDYYTYTSSSGSSWECGGSSSSGQKQMLRGLEVDGSTFYMRCQKDQYYNDRDQLEAWSVSGTSDALIPESTTRQISRLGYGLQFDGERFVTVDCGYSSWSGATLLP